MIWRTMQRLPERRRIGIFNRSYYEEVLVARVHPDLLKREKIPPSLPGKNILCGMFISHYSVTSISCLLPCP
jgi:polyphosphate kinase 2 (PPK2 family)